jgi:hypothetical protein
MTELRKRMVQDRTIRGFTPETQDKYLEAVEALARHYQRPPDRLIPEQIREYLLYLIETRPRAKSTFRVHLSALKFLYRWTLGWSWPIWALPRIQSDKKRPVVLRRVEVWCLLDHVRKPSARRSLTLMDIVTRIANVVTTLLDDVDDGTERSCLLPTAHESLLPIGLVAARRRVGPQGLRGVLFDCRSRGSRRHAIAAPFSCAPARFGRRGTLCRRDTRR